MMSELCLSFLLLCILVPSLGLLLLNGLLVSRLLDLVLAGELLHLLRLKLLYLGHELVDIVPNHFFQVVGDLGVGLFGVGLLSVTDAKFAFKVFDLLTILHLILVESIFALVDLSFQLLVLFLHLLDFGL